MNLPHREPLIFAKKVIDKSDHAATVLCDFGELPTLPMFIEAAAQSSAAFAPDGESAIGFLVLCKDIKRLAPLTEISYHIEIRKIAEINTTKKFLFEAFSIPGKTKCVSGTLTIVIQE